MGCQGSDAELHGKPVADSTYIVAYLKQPDAVVDNLIYRQEQQDLGSFGRMYIGYLQNVVTSKVYDELSNRGAPFIRKGANGRDLYLDDVLLMSQRLPQGLAWADEEMLSMVRGLLESFLLKQQKETEKVVDLPELVTYNRLGKREASKGLFDVVFTDLSELFFVPGTTIAPEAVEGEAGAKPKKQKAKTIKPKLTEFLGQSTSVVEVSVKHNVYGAEATVKVPLTVGLDIARRNVLGGVVDKNPKLYALTWRVSDHGFRYATVLQTEDDVAIWCGVHSNLRALPAQTK